MENMTTRPPETKSLSGDLNSAFDKFMRSFEA